MAESIGFSLPRIFFVSDEQDANLARAKYGDDRQYLATVSLRSPSRDGNRDADRINVNFGKGSRPVVMARAEVMPFLQSELRTRVERTLVRDQFKAAFIALTEAGDNAKARRVAEQAIGNLLLEHPFLAGIWSQPAAKTVVESETF